MQIKCIVKQRGFDQVSYLDYMAAAEIWVKADDCFQCMRDTVRECWGRDAETKAVKPTYEMVFLGVLFDTQALTLQVSNERLQEAMELLGEWTARTHATRKQVQSIMGKLSFMAACVRPGRLFISRILDFLRGLPNTGKHELTNSVKKDLFWWRAFLPQYNGFSMMPMENWSLPGEVFASDACLEGCGAWFWGVFPYEIPRLHH